MTPTRFTYTIEDEGPAPDPGDWISTTRSHYLVTKIRPVATRDGARRFKVEALRFEVFPGSHGSKRFGMRWFPRRRRRR